MTDQERLVTITYREYANLLKRNAELTAMEWAGVDNWVGLSEASLHFEGLMAEVEQKLAAGNFEGGVSGVGRRGDKFLAAFELHLSALTTKYNDTLALAREHADLELFAEAYAYSDVIHSLKKLLKQYTEIGA